MTRVEIVAIVLRLAGIWMFANGIVSMAIAINRLSVDPEFTAIAVLPVMFMGVAVATFCWAIPLARKLLPEPDPGDPVSRWTKGEVETVAFRLLGIYLLVIGVSGLGHGLVLGQQMADQSWPTPSDRALHLAELVRDAMTSVLGLGLVLGPAKLKQAWASFRGRDQDEQLDD
jgi:hypothetical protein